MQATLSKTPERGPLRMPAGLRARLEDVTYIATSRNIYHIDEDGFPCTDKTFVLEKLGRRIDTPEAIEVISSSKPDIANARKFSDLALLFPALLPALGWVIVLCNATGNLGEIYATTACIISDIAAFGVCHFTAKSLSKGVVNRLFKAVGLMPEFPGY